MYSSVANPAVLRETSTDVSPISALPDAVHELVEYETACAYAEGWRAALEAVAAGQVELDEAWRPVGRRGYEQQVAERVALFERCAAEWHARYGTRPWDGVRDELQERRQAA